MAPATGHGESSSPFSGPGLGAPEAVATTATGPAMALATSHGERSAHRISVKHAHSADRRIEEL
eukprot:9570879-Lingulodinium_polyedra.AAC.1